VKLNRRVLVRKDDPQGEIYSGCEVYVSAAVLCLACKQEGVCMAFTHGRYRRNALIKRPDSDQVEDGIMYGIASVVTPIPHLSEHR
jgi:hypothetical protein